MTSKQAINRIIKHQNPERFGINFKDPLHNDIEFYGVSLVKKGNEYSSWGQHKSLLEQVPWFNGDVLLDSYGNILGRLNGKTKGECVKGALQDGWELLDNFELPEIDFSFNISIRDKDKYNVCGSPFSVFSVLRDTRLMDNALMDVVLEKSNVEKFLQKIVERNLSLASYLKKQGIDALFICDDWGTQHSTFISPDCFKELFVPAYKAIADGLHKEGLSFIVHSCGYNYKFIEHFITAGIDVLQFDQTEIYPSKVLADEFGDKISFFCCVDIQKVLPTGDREYIERKTLEMIENFRKCGGSLIFKEYPSYEDIEIKQEWADWSKQIILDNLKI